MREDKPSSTAAIVAGARAAIDENPTIRDFADPFAERLLPPWYAAQDDSPVRRSYVRLVRRALRRGAHVIGLRTVAIDEGIRSAPDTGQVVILGAGLDARAWRMPELAESTVFEVDHPATQRYKRERVADFPELADHRFVSVDFEHDSLDARLAACGHRIDVPTVWIWEGVTMYLRLEAIEATLGTLSQRSAVDSRLLVTYLPPSAARRLVGIGTRLFGEGFHSAFDPGQMNALLNRFGFDVELDESATEWHDHWALDGVRLSLGFAAVERLATARRTDRA